MNSIVMLVVAVLSAIGAFGTLVWAVVRERHKPELDSMEIKKSVDASNRDRDIWMRRLDVYLFEDSNWHRAVVRLFHQLQDQGLIPDDVVIPAPPVVPEPPPYGLRADATV